MILNILWRRPILLLGPDGLAEEEEDPPSGRPADLFTFCDAPGCWTEVSTSKQCGSINVWKLQKKWEHNPKSHKTYNKATALKAVQTPPETLSIAEVWRCWTTLPCCTNVIDLFRFVRSPIPISIVSQIPIFVYHFGNIHIPFNVCVRQNSCPGMET